MMEVGTPMTWAIHHGDCLDIMRALPAQSVDAVITSPPYAEQRKATYGGIPETDYPAWTVAWMREARRLLKSDGSAVINIRPHVRDGQISDYTLRTRLALRDDGWAEIEELIWHKGGAPFGHTRRPRRSWESLHWFALHGRPYSDPKAGGLHRQSVRGGAGRSGPHIRTPLAVAFPDGWTGIARVPDVVTISTGKNENDTDLNRHPAVYPPALAEWIGKLTVPAGGTILDPFSGSASTGVACIRNGWNYVGIDAVEEYVTMSRRRLDALTPVLV
jgi:site-specific DNA-methyltransferase (adenine-specific)